MLDLDNTLWGGVIGDDGLDGIKLGQGSGVGHKSGAEMLIDSWLMSCRVLGRGVEKATLGVLARAAALLGVERLRGRYIPSPKNKMVADHYEKLGFSPAGEEAGGVTGWTLDLAGYAMPDLFIKITKVEQ